MVQTTPLRHTRREIERKRRNFLKQVTHTDEFGNLYKEVGNEFWMLKESVIFSFRSMRGEAYPVFTKTISTPPLKKVKKK